ncbi:helix-turn-helix transcriptional regulator [Calidifontibacter sp. DB0510]|uniref:Helix-turn-helix transcriptional regulator n=1 Tax=Metallococcus carri TaxID=1656884 RepID=A0A967B2Z5_9MICO|nr:helix-turn-helix domain-containing protein [Metallococcus carri]NHN56435.1 helix-turn-helix transcriptional regulator [Metallococcus carri]NOP36059.1 helix-turn-helix transcriptional regulator [Calidifontibacter sp. DB2511S]
MTSPRTVVPDTAQLKALAHPVRLQMLGMLRLDGAATASQLADRLGLNSGATSYHLRQLADAGLIEDDAERGNARDRWWRAAHRSTETANTSADPQERAVLETYLGAVVGTMIARLQESVVERPELPARWATAVDASDWAMWLTPERARELEERVHATIGEFAEGALDEADAPEGAAQFLVQFHGFPRPGTVVHREEEA